MKFSIIIPIYNREKYVKQTINSIRNQTYENLEIICVNDFSTDNSLDVLHELKKKDNRIKIINQPVNLGTHAARRIGVEYATGEYVLFLDCDDVLQENACTILFQILSTHSRDVLEFAYINKQTGSISIPVKNITADNLFDSLVYFKNPRAGTIWNKAYAVNVVKFAFSKMQIFFSIMGEDLYESIIIAYYTKSYSFITNDLLIYNDVQGVSNKKKSITAITKDLTSIKNTIEGFSVFFTVHAPEHHAAVKILEYFYIEYMIYNQILPSVKRADWKKAINLLPEYFSEKTLEPYLKKINAPVSIIQINFWFYKINKSLRRLTPQPIKKFIKKHLNLKQL